MKYLVLLVLCTCALNKAAPPTVTVAFHDGDHNAGTIPFKVGGPFSVTVTTDIASVGETSHALVEIISSTIPTDAIATATVTLTKQDETTVAGTGYLKWPTGGPLQVRVTVAEFVNTYDVTLETPMLTLTPSGSLAYSGAQLTQAACVESSSTDGSVTLHVEGGKLDSGMADGIVALTPGVCGAMEVFDPNNPSSIAKLKVNVADPNVQVFASLPPTPAMAELDLVAPPEGALTLELTTPTLMPTRDSIADVTVTAKVSGVITKNIVVSFATIPAVTVTPATAKTDDNGEATASVQIPFHGSLRVTASSGDAAPVSATFWP